MWRVVIAGKVQIAQQAAVVPPRLDRSHKGNCHCHEGPLIWCGKMSEMVSAQGQFCSQFHLKSFKVKSWSGSKLSCHYKLKAQGPSLISVGMTRSFLDTSILYRVLPWLLLTTSVWPQSTGSKSGCWACAIAPQTTRCPENVSWVAPTVRRIKASFQYKIHSIYIITHILKDLPATCPKASIHALLQTFIFRETKIASFTTIIERTSMEKLQNSTLFTMMFHVRPSWCMINIHGSYVNMYDTMYMIWYIYIHIII